MPVLSHFVSLPRLFLCLQSLLLKITAGISLSFALIALPAHAQLASLPSSGLELTQLEMLDNAPLGLSLEQVRSGQAGAFVPQLGLQITHSHWHRAVWLKLRLKATPSASPQAHAAVLELPIAYIDKAWLYTPAAQADSAWQRQQAGDFFAPQTWAMRGFHPKFHLPGLSDAAWRGQPEMELYLQIETMSPVAFPIELSDAQAAMDQDLLQLLLLGLGLGAIALAALLTAAMAGLHRDSIYAWYSVYAICAALACAGHAGIAIHVLWPVAGHWPSTAELTFIMLATLCQIRFAWVLNGQTHVWPAWRWLVNGASCLCLALAVSFPFFPAYWKEFYLATLLTLGCAMVLIVWLMVLALRAGHRLAGIWMLANLPLFASLLLGLTEATGLIPSSFWSRSAPVYATFSEVLILGLALQWFAKERHGERERRKTLAATDPLTGFVTEQAFQAQLLRDWYSSQKPQRHLAVAYIQLQTRANSEEQLQLMLTRCVRILRSATSVQDVVARLDGSLMALLIYNASAGDELSQRLSRIVALGLMPDSGDRAVSVLQFRIAATTNKQFKKPLAELDAQMRDLLAQPSGWGSKPIRYIDHTIKKTTNPFVLESAALEETWENAFKQEMSNRSELDGSTTR